MFSIDQNCHSLWDVPAKLAALVAAGIDCEHFVEDVDTAFTAVGATTETPLRLARERYYHGGAADWGAAVFYMPFLATLPLDPVGLEPTVGMTLAAAGRKMGLSVDELYDHYSPGGAWQLIGPSFIDDDRRDLHRVIGDVTVSEAAPFIRELLKLASDDMLQAFPATDSRDRTTQWMQRQSERSEALIAQCAADRLPDLYAKWLADDVPKSVAIAQTSQLFACGADLVGREMLEIFTRDYPTATALYNEAVTETNVGLRPLHDAELPMFACLDIDGHSVRTNMFLRDGCVCIEDKTFALDDGRLPLGAMAAGGVKAVAGKAAVLFGQVRSGRRGHRVAIPYNGSLYIPAVHRLESKLRAGGLLTESLKPIVRVRLRLLDRLADLDVPIRLPEHLAAAFGTEEISSRRFAATWADVAEEAAARLTAFENADSRLRWQQDTCANLVDAIAELDARRRQLAARKAPPEEIRPVGAKIRPLQMQLLQRTFEQTVRDWQTARLDYCDSRGAIEPWAIALGGEDFYRSVIDRAEIYQESPEAVA